MPVSEIIYERSFWNTEAIVKAAGRVINSYAGEFGELTLENWRAVIAEVLSTNRGVDLVIARMPEDPFKLSFVGPRYLSHNEKGVVRWEASEPRIVPIEDGSEFRTPETVLNNARSNKLEVFSDPLQFVFSKARFAELTSYRGVFFFRN